MTEAVAGFRATRSGYFHESDLLGAMRSRFEEAPGFALIVKKFGPSRLYSLRKRMRDYGFDLQRAFLGRAMCRPCACGSSRWHWGPNHRMLP